MAHQGAVVSPDNGWHRCPECYEPVPARVKICPNCKSFQDWRRYAAIGQVNLALIVAFISVLTAAIPAIIYIITSSKADIRISLIPKVDSVEILATNQGRRAGAILDAFLVISGTDENDKKRISKVPIQRSAPESQNSKLLKPTEWIALSYENHGGGSDLTRSLIIKKDAVCQLEVDVTDADGSLAKKISSIQCVTAQIILGLSPVRGDPLLRRQLQSFTGPQFVALANLMQQYLGARSPQLRQLIGQIDPKATRLSGNGTKAQQVINAWLNEDDVSPANQQQWLDSIAAVATSAITREIYEKASNSRIDVDNIGKNHINNGALSSELTEDDSHWVLTTVWPGN